MAESKCPVCGRPVDPSNVKALPFCSQRCKQIDLGRWLGEAYSLPIDLEGDPSPEDFSDS